jgi:hypothetical protein
MGKPAGRPRRPWTLTGGGVRLTRLSQGVTVGIGHDVRAEDGPVASAEAGQVGAGSGVPLVPPEEAGRVSIDVDASQSPRPGLSVGPGPRSDRGYATVGGGA